MSTRNKRNRIIKTICTGQLCASSDKNVLNKLKKYNVVYTYTKGLFNTKVLSIDERLKTT